MVEWYDMTISIDKFQERYPGVHMRDWLSGMCEEWGYGIECGEGGYRHYQIRGQFKGAYKDQLVLVSLLHGIGRVSPTSKACMHDYSYIRKEGEWYLSNEKPLWRYKDESQLWTWQKEVKEIFLSQNDREILCVVDETGGQGKSFLCRHLESTHQAKIIPKFEQPSQMIEVAFAYPSPGYIIDIPRSDKSRAAVYAAIEQLKNGHLYDRRYAYKEKWIEPPAVMVITNKKPSLKELTRDRWIIYELDGTLINVDEDIHSEES